MFIPQAGDDLFQFFSFLAPHHRWSFCRYPRFCGFIGPSTLNLTFGLYAKDFLKLTLLLYFFFDSVFIDQQNVVINGATGGTAYATYGISRNGAIVVVRPDGYVGTVAPLDNPQHVDQYFGAFINH